MLLVAQYTLHYMGTVLEVRVKPKTIVMVKFIVRDTQGFNFSVHVQSGKQWQVLTCKVKKTVIYKLLVMACSYCISVRVLWVVKVYCGTPRSGCKKMPAGMTQGRYVQLSCLILSQQGSKGVGKLPVHAYYLLSLSQPKIGLRKVDKN